MLTFTVGFGSIPDLKHHNDLINVKEAKMPKCEESANTLLIIKKM